MKLSGSPTHRLPGSLPLLTRLDRVPPYLYRFLAKTPASPGYRAKSVREIALAGGLSPRTVERLSLATSFSGVTVETADRFIHGCGFHPFQQSRLLESLRRITESKRGLSGVRHVASVSKLELWELASRRRHLRRLKTILEKI